jgi:hypothetical protein
MCYVWLEISIHIMNVTPKGMVHIKNFFAIRRDPDAISPTSQSSTLFLTSTLDGVGWLMSCPGRFTPGNGPLLIL